MESIKTPDSARGDASVLYFLCWAPKPAGALVPRVEPFRAYGRGEKQTPLEKLFDEASFADLFVRQLDAVSYQFRSDGIGIVAIEPTMGIDGKFSNAQQSLLCEATCAAVKNRVGHTHVFHPVTGKKRGADQTIKFRPIEIPSLMAEKELFSADAVFKLPPRSALLAGFKKLVTSKERMQFLLENDQLLSRIKTKHPCVFDSGGSVYSRTSEMPALLHIRAVYSKSFDLFFGIRRRIRDFFINKHAPWLTAHLALIGVLLPYYLYVVASRDTIGAVLPGVVTLAAPVVFYMTIGLPVLSRIKGHKAVNPGSTPWIERLLVWVKKALRKRSTYIAVQTYAFIALFDVPFVFPLGPIEQIRLPAGVHEYFFVIWGASGMLLLWLYLVLFFYWYTDVHLKRLKTINLIKTTKAVLIFGSVYTSIIKPMYLNIAPDRQGDFSSAIAILDIVNASERKGLIRAARITVFMASAGLVGGVLIALHAIFS